MSRIRVFQIACGMLVMCAAFTEIIGITVGGGSEGRFEQVVMLVCLIAWCLIATARGR